MLWIDPFLDATRVSLHTYVRARLSHLSVAILSQGTAGVSGTRCSAFAHLLHPSSSAGIMAAGGEPLSQFGAGNVNARQESFQAAARRGGRSVRENVESLQDWPDARPRLRELILRTFQEIWPHAQGPRDQVLFPQGASAVEIDAFHDAFRKQLYDTVAVHTHSGLPARLEEGLSLYDV